MPLVIPGADPFTAKDLVELHLRAMEMYAENGDPSVLMTARSVLHERFRAIFPGTGLMADPDEIRDWAAGRYRRISKTIDEIETLQYHGADVVYVRGTLSGEWPNGDPFAGIRFVDRFEIRDRKIYRQEVWNDLAEMRPR